jgi:putative two-component system response regulator
VYKSVISPKEAVEIIMKGSGNHFDPLIVEVFYDIQDHFEAAHYLSD